MSPADDTILFRRATRKLFFRCYTMKQEREINIDCVSFSSFFLKKFLLNHGSVNYRLRLLLF